MLLALQHSCVLNTHLRDNKELSGAVVNSLDYCAADPIPGLAGAEFPTAIELWVITKLGIVA